MMNRKGSTFTGWTEVIILVGLLIVSTGFIMSGMNDTYDKSYNSTFGLSTDDTFQSFIEQQDTFKSSVEEGETGNEGDSGLSWSSSWTIITGAIKIIWNFITGGFIEDLFNLLNLPVGSQIIIAIIRVLWFLSVSFILLKILFKVVP